MANPSLLIKRSAALLYLGKVRFRQREILAKGIGVDPVGQALSRFHWVGEAVKGDGWQLTPWPRL